MTRIPLTIVLSIIPLVASAQDSDLVANSKLAVVKIVPAKHGYKLGEPIEATLLLEAGRKGVYVAKSWGQAGGGVPGFFVLLETAAGKPAQTCGSTADTSPIENRSPKELLQQHFILLRPGRIIGWKTTIDCPLKRRGKYRIKATYSPGLPETKLAADLPETNGLVLKQSVDASPRKYPFIRTA